ncbi:hypothetical protein H6F32_09940 [Anabaena sp. FACHB-1237]|uniref:DUF2614 family zinc ribbon-containing protein n=1 Tax=Anabaena sp. FACHB-1237 TaxID=2692769 RepID=UPI00168057AF|nr:DUF2614 family zinc ribbon-containing protein [Anabaena sp. FACHB-1237]MBD2137901.1 hypothetical protein [Anabaena sp. FACHB-1237]
MNFKNLQLDFEQVRPWLTLLIIAWIITSLGLGWLVKSLLFIFGLILFLPIVLFFGLRWWLSKSIITDKCPMCGHEQTALNNSQFQCMNCGEILSVTNNHFQRFAPDGTIDVTAVEVQAKSLED